MLCDLIAFDSLGFEPDVVYDVPKDRSEVSSALSGEILTRAGGVAFNAMGFGDRLFVWHSDDDKLRIRELSFGNDISNSSIEFRFSNAKVLHCGIYHERSGLFVLVTTTDGVYHRHFTCFKQNESVFNSKSVFGSKFYPIRGLVSQEVACSTTFRYKEDCSLFAYGLKGGVVIFVSLSDHDQEMQVLPMVSHRSNLWPGIIPLFSNKQDSGNLECPVSMAFLNDGTANPILVCVCKDHYFRAWDLKHCRCSSTVDLLKCLNAFSGYFNTLTTAKQRTLAFTPGANHCVKTCEDFALVYLELIPTKKLPLPPIQMTYWIWMRLNNHENKIAFDVVHVEPIKTMANPQFSLNPAVGSLIDFVPFLSQNSSKTPDVPMDISSTRLTLPTLSVWSVMDVPNEEGYAQSTLQLNKYDSDGFQLPLMPTLSLTGYANMQLWQEPLPQSILVPKRSYDAELSMSDDITEKGVDLTAFMDFIFTPGRFAKVAIYDAFKSLKQSHHLPQECSSPDDVTIMRREVSHALISDLQPSLSVVEFQTLLRTFHQTIVDYHQRASEPLGLFCVESSGDVVVVHRSGLSVARRLQPMEEALLNPSFLNYCPTGSDLEVLTSNHRAAKLRAREFLISRCRRIVKDLTQCQVWLEHERKICDNSENFQHTEAVFNQLLADLPANQLVGWEEDGIMEGIDDAFSWFLESFFTTNSIEAITTDLEGEEVEEDPTHKSLHQRSSCPPGFGSRLSAELLRQGVRQATNTSLRFCVAMHLLWRHWNHHFATSLGSSRIEGRLQQIYRCLAIIHWLTTTRAAPPSDRNFLSLVWTHLRILGMDDRSVDFAPVRELCSGYSIPDRMRFQFHGLSLFEELILSAPEVFSGLPGGTGQLSWRTHSSTIITALQKLLCPILKNGETIVPILKHLLLGARCKELLTLCKCLAPNAFHTIDVKGLPSVCRDEQMDGASKSVLRNGSWWPGDTNALYVCAFLALLWSGLTDEAVEQYIQGSLYLQRRLLSILHPFASECAQELALGDNVVAPCSLLEKLFPAEFALSGSLGFPTSIQDSQSVPPTPLLVYEVQIRYLIKAMPVLEQLDKPQHVIRLCEYALEIIQKSSSDACAKGILDFGVNPRLSSPLCDGAQTSALDEWIISKEKASHIGFFPASALCTDDEKFLSLAQNLSELEAVLRTRIFRHELALGNIARAHALVISNPDKARQRDCLHLLITTLCDRGQTAELVNFEYGSLEDELVFTLKSRARAAGLLPKSAPRRRVLKEGAVEQEENVFYAVLYAYYVRRSKFHSAVEVCFEQALRLAEESAMLPLTPFPRAKSDSSWGSGSWVLAVLQQQALCLSACINTLELLPSQDQWIFTRDSEAAFLSDVESCASTSGVSWAFDSEEEEDASENRLSERGSEKMPAFEDILNSNNSTRRQARARILKLTDLEHQYLVVRARLRLAEVSWEQGMLRARSTSLHDLYSALIATALYEEAFQLLVAFDLDPSPLVTAIAARCVALAEHQQTTKDAMAPCLPALTNSAAPLNTERILVTKSTAALYDYLSVAGDVMVEVNRKSDLLDLYWSLLKALLANLGSRGTLRFGDKPQAKWDFDLLACRTILAGSSIQLPCWLMRFLSSSPSGPVMPLLRLLLDHNRLREAYRLVHAILLTVIGPKTDQCPALLKEVDLQQLQMNLVSTPDHVASSSIHLPHSLFIRLLEALAVVSHKSQAYRFMHTQLQSLLKQYYSTLLSVDAKHRQLRSH